MVSPRGPVEELTFLRTFAVAGPTTWNLFQNNLREPDMQIDCFRRTLKTCLFDQYSAH